MVITLSLRTPLAKSFKGGMKDTEMDYVLYTLLKEVLGKSKVDPALIEDVCLGNVSIRGTQTEHSFHSTNANRSATAKPPTSCAPPLWPQESRTRPAGHR